MVKCPVCNAKVGLLTMHNKLAHSGKPTVAHGLVHEAASTDCQFCGRHFTSMMDHNMHNMQHGRLSGNLCVGKGCAVTFKRLSDKALTVVTHANNTGGDQQSRVLTNTPYGEPSIDELRSFCDSCHAQDMQTQYAQDWYTALQIQPGTIFPMAAGEDLKWAPAPVPLAVSPDQPLPSTIWPQVAWGDNSWGGSPNYAPQPQWGTPSFAPVPTQWGGTPNFAPLSPGQWDPATWGPGYPDYAPPELKPEPVKPKPKKKEHPKPTVKRRLIDLDL